MVRRPYGIVDGTDTLQKCGERVFETMVRVASGEKTKSEILGMGEAEFAPWPLGVKGRVKCLRTPLRQVQRESIHWCPTARPITAKRRVQVAPNCSRHRLKTISRNFLSLRSKT